MAEKRVIKVLIAGKVMTMSGYESEEYMQRVAAYINSKIEEYEKTDAFRHAASDIRHRMLELNFADSYFKEKEHAEDLEQRLKDKIDELDEMKHNYVNSQVMVDDQKKDVEGLEAKLREAEKTITRLQTTLQEREKSVRDLQSAIKEIGRDPRLIEHIAAFKESRKEQPAEKKEEAVTESRPVSEAPEAKKEEKKEEKEEKKEPLYIQTSIEDLYREEEKTGSGTETPKSGAPQPTGMASEAFRSNRNGKHRR